MANKIVLFFLISASIAVSPTLANNLPKYTTNASRQSNVQSKVSEIIEETEKIKGNSQENKSWKDKLAENKQVIVGVIMVAAGVIFLGKKVWDKKQKNKS